MDFSKSIMLTSEQYISAAAQLKETKANVARQKEIARAEKEERRKRKKIEREDERRAKEIRVAEVAEARLQKAAQREEARVAREARAAEAAHARAVKAAEKETLKAQRAERAIRATEARAQREGSKARRAAAAHNRAMEMAQGRRTPTRHAGDSSEACASDLAPNRLQPQTQASAIHLPFGGFVTHATSTLHSPPYPPLTTARSQFDRCQPWRNTSTWQQKEDTL
jgi:hypothetical protein